MATKIQGYYFDGDPDGLKFISWLDYEELQTMVYDADNRGKGYVEDSYNKTHFEVTKSPDGTYMVSKVKPSGSSSWF